ncbi:bifunctional Queuine tRNA-ribosyltransferase-like/tRNA-guanine(15) transglycosylase-like [Babesia duncani]|uniref:Bifunctional Queuine tRNA-ribosyltransferase-like/tRNA-guanine(15) transglycosylase-like n=1 Tax=Babesia duncani TaxID=323732 RepID=A0AAD9PMJ1_9APIC|nr:bifunctional Queuine tRNA-ribosyltransferase-like/tRNA-guanine(15) transglycosylase-like [Babesia duncani]
MITPEESISIQNDIGADIMMALDDVVEATCTDYQRLKLATERTTRWLDRCIASHRNPSTQLLFPIVQGNVYPELRMRSLEDLKARNMNGYAIGGLSGGEDKEDFWKVVELCTRPQVGLPTEKPRYLMGVGYTIDLIVAVAFGCDLFDCVFPTRTARFGTALLDCGELKIKHASNAFDFGFVDTKILND